MQKQITEYEDDFSCGDGFESKVILNFPPTALALYRNDSVIVSGGGGPGRTGIPNNIILFRFNTNGFRLIKALDTQDHPVMNMAHHPKTNILACSIEDKCRVYCIGAHNLYIISEFTTEFGIDGAGCQKRVRFTPSGTRMATLGIHGEVFIWSFPQLEQKKRIQAHTDSQGTEAIDLDLTNTLIASATRNECKIFGQDSGRVIAYLGHDVGLSFRNLRFSPTKSPNHQAEFLYVVEFQCFSKSVVKMWDTRNWSCIRRINISLAQDHITAFSLSQNGIFFAIGSAEGHVRVYDALKMSELMRITPHSFYVSDLVIIESENQDPSTSNSNLKSSIENPIAKVISISGDNTLQVHLVKPKSKFRRVGLILLLFIAIFIGLMTHVRPQQMKLLTEIYGKRLNKIHSLFLE